MIKCEICGEKMFSHANVYSFRRAAYAAVFGVELLTAAPHYTSLVSCWSCYDSILCIRVELVQNWRLRV